MVPFGGRAYWSRLVGQGIVILLRVGHLVLLRGGASWSRLVGGAYRSCLEQIGCPHPILRSLFRSRGGFVVLIGGNRRRA